jgi:hypothetical protein
LTSRRVGRYRTQWWNCDQEYKRQIPEEIQSRVFRIAARRLPKLDVAGSTPVARSNDSSHREPHPPRAGIHDRVLASEKNCFLAFPVLTS